MPRFISITEKTRYQVYKENMSKTQARGVLSELRVKGKEAIIRKMGKRYVVLVK